MEVYRAAEQGIDLLAQHESQAQEQMQVANTPQQQETGLREEHAQGNTQASMAFPDVQPNQSFNTVGMKAPINIEKVNDQGHLVESYKNVPPGIQDLPTGPYEGTIIESPAAYQKGGVKEDEQIYNAGLLPEVEVSALTDKTYNTLSNPQKQVYDSFVTPDGIAQTVEINERTNYGGDRQMHWKNALQMTEDLGIRNIYNKPKSKGRKMNEQTGNFRAHADAMFKNVYIPRHIKNTNQYKLDDPYSPYMPNNIDQDLEDLTYEEKMEFFKQEGEQEGRSKYFDSLIAEYAHIPEFWRINSLGTIPITMAKRAYRGIKEGEMPDASNYKDPHDFEYQTHTGPDSFEEKLRSKYEIKQKGGLRGYQGGGFNFNTAKDYSTKKTNHYSPEAIQERKDNNPYKGLSLSEKLDLGLTTAGMAPAFGIIPDAINTVSNLGQGAYHSLTGDKEQASQDYTNAAWAAGGMIPFGIGQAFASTKLGAKILSKTEALKNIVKTKGTSKGTSDINWGKFNKEIPSNTALMDEYKHIEEITKQRGTWMKNLDGSTFKGSPEQFVQHKSKNFNLAYPEGYESVYRGVDKSGSTSLRSKYPYNQVPQGKPVTDPRTNMTGLFSGDKVVGGSYGDKVHNLAMRNSPNSLKIEGLGSGWLDLHSIGVTRKTLQKNIDNLEKTIKPGTKPEYHGGYDAAAQLKSYKNLYNNYDKIVANPMYKKLLNHKKEVSKLAKKGNRADIYSTDDIAQFLQKEGLDNIQLKYIDDQMFGNVNISNQVPGNYLKNLEGNRGTFDLTSPNPDFQKGGFKSKYQVGGLRNHMMDYLHTSGRDTTYVNTVMNAIKQHESKNNPNQVQVSGNKTDGYYDGPGRGSYQYEVGPDAGGNTAINRTVNFLKHNTDKNMEDFPNLNTIYNAGNSLDFTNLSKKDQDALFIGDKIFGGVPRRDAFDAVTRNRTTPPSQEETFQYWLTNHKGKVNGKSISELTEKEIEVERKKWNSRTKKVFKQGGYKKRYL
tara:strand:+ start:1644 stop:4634 length:2991 start_codon:yes stop_codon:yes gene_type:complete